MKVTKEQYNKWNGQLSNGWVLDLERLVVWGEKDIKLKEQISENEILEFSLYYTEVFENYRYTGFYDIKLTKRIWKKSENSECWTTSGLGCQKIIAKKVSNKKLYKNLVELSKDISLEDAKALFTGNEVNPMS